MNILSTNWIFENTIYKYAVKIDGKSADQLFI